MDKSTFEKRDMRLYTPAFDITQSTEVGGEMTMPDYYPEIRKVVAVTAEALPDSKYLSDKSLELGGTVAFSLLYIGDDGTLTSVPYVTEFSQSMPLGRDFNGGTSDIIAQSTAESVICRPLAPRTVSLKAKVKSRAEGAVFEECSLSVINEDRSTAATAVRRTLEYLESEIPTVCRRVYSATGNIAGDERASIRSKPVFCRGDVLVHSAATVTDAVNVKGEVLVSCLVLGDDGMYRTVTKALPFEERISAEGIGRDAEVSAYGRAASVSVECDDDGTLSFDAEYDVDAVIADVSSAFITRDVYSREYALLENRREINVQSLICLGNGTVSASGEGRRRSGKGEGDYLIFATAEPRIERADILDSKAVFSGSCTFKALIASDGDIITEEFSVPIKYECPSSCDAGAGETVWQAQAFPGKVECRLEDTKISAVCPLHVFVNAVKSERLSPVTEAVAGAREENAEGGNVIRICYPEKGELIWSIAKSTHARLGECERINRVTRTDTSDGSPLIMK